MDAGAAQRALLERALVARGHELEHERLRRAGAAAVIEILRTEGAVEQLGRPIRRGFRLGGRGRETGGIAGRIRASGLLLPRWYARRHELDPDGRSAATHFATVGIERGMAPNPLFEPDWYAERHSVARGEAAFRHYLDIGAGHALPPGPLFDSLAYLHAEPDAAGAPDALVHFLRHGIAAGRLPEPVRISWD